MKQRIAIFMTMVMALVTCFSICPITADAAIDSEVVETYTCTVDGVERTLTVYENGEAHFNIGEEVSMLVSLSFSDIKFNENGTIWSLSPTKTLRWWNYDLMPEAAVLKVIPRPTVEDSYAYVDNVTSLILDDDQKFVIGYTTSSGEAFYLLTLDEMETIISSDDPSTYPTPRPMPVSPSIPTPTPTSDPTVKPTVSPTPTPTVQPTVSPEPNVENTKVSIKEKSGYTCLYTGSKITSKYKLTKKGVLTWKSGSKTKKFIGVKSAGFIKKSKNLIFMTKKGKAFTVSSKGKKKTIVKKGAKKLILKGKFVTKVKKVSGSVNVTKK